MGPRRYLLDTNVLSELIRHPAGLVAERVSALTPDRLVTSIVVACELRFGAGKKGSARLSELVELLLAKIEVLPFEPGADRHYAEIRVELERSGQPIGHNDLLIAAQAKQLDLVLVTANVDEFSRVPGLVVENWLA